jgi:hypothetical protein
MFEELDSVPKYLSPDCMQEEELTLSLIDCAICCIWQTRVLLYSVYIQRCIHYRVV